MPALNGTARSVKPPKRNTAVFDINVRGVLHSMRHETPVMLRFAGDALRDRIESIVETRPLDISKHGSRLQTVSKTAVDSSGLLSIPAERIAMSKPPSTGPHGSEDDRLSSLPPSVLGGGHSLLHSDRDFDAFEKVLGLDIVHP
jgi:hypothetical protein